MLTVGPGLVWNLADVSLAAGTLLATVLLVKTWPQSNARRDQEVSQYESQEVRG
jgi:hypothetical protein